MKWFNAEIKVEKPYSVLRHLHLFSVPGKPVPCIIEKNVFRRAVPVENTHVPLKVEIDEFHGVLNIFWHGEPGFREKVLYTVKHIFAVDVSYGRFLEYLSEYPILFQIAQKYRGLRPTRNMNLYEALIKVVLQQRIALKIALRTTARLVERFGIKIELGDDIYYSFPLPHTIAEMNIENIRTLGTTKMKAKSIIEIAKKAEENSLPTTEDVEKDPDSVVQELMKIYGVGRWTAELAVATLRHDFSVGPAGDLNVMKGFKSILGVKGEREIRLFLEKFGEWRGLIMYLLALEMENVR